MIIRSVPILITTGSRHWHSAYAATPGAALRHKWSLNLDSVLRNRDDRVTGASPWEGEQGHKHGSEGQEEHLRCMNAVLRAQISHNICYNQLQDSRTMPCKLLHKNR